MIFLDVLAYSAMLVFAVCLLTLGVLLFQRSKQRMVLDLLIGAERAGAALASGELTDGHCKWIGAAFCLIACFLIFCIVRGIAHA